VNEAQMRAIFLLAGIDISSVFELPNGYWPDVPNYAELRRESPWWLVRTEAGMVKIGWRKRVISIDWSDTCVRQVVTLDDVTKDEALVHAYSYGKAVEYLTTFRRSMQIALEPERED
jgi:hypothetical protein